MNGFNKNIKNCEIVDRKVISRQIKAISYQFSQFTLVGALGTACHYLLFLIMVEGFSFSPVLSSMAGFILGALVNYVLNYRFTFRSDMNHRDSVPKFFGVAAVGFLMNVLILWGALYIANAHYLLSQLTATGVVLLWNFEANRRWTFRRRL